jgi:hypothetical protein
MLARFFSFKKHAFKKLLTGGIRDDTLATVSIDETRFRLREDDRVSRESVGDSIQRFRKAISMRMVVGTFSTSSDTAFIEIGGHTGFDFVTLDLEHGPNTVLTLQDLIRAAAVADLFPIINVTLRVPPVIS